MNLCFIDVETTGTDPKRNGIIQISGQIETGGELVDPFDFRVKPLRHDVIEDQALEVNRVSRADLNSDDYLEANFVKKSFDLILGRYVDKYDPKDKLFFVAYNAIFDYLFMRQWYEKQGDKYFGSWFWFPPIDVMGLAARALGNRRRDLPNFKLGTVAQAMGVEVSESELHDAKVDIGVTREIYNMIEVREISAALSAREDAEERDRVPGEDVKDVGNAYVGPTYLYHADERVDEEEGEPHKRR